MGQKRNNNNNKTSAAERPLRLTTNQRSFVGFISARRDLIVSRPSPPFLYIPAGGRARNPRNVANLIIAAAVVTR